MDRFSLEIPPSPEFVGTARIFAGAVARQHGAQEADVHDLKLAVSELCSAGARDGGESLLVSLTTSEDGSLTVEVEGAAAALEALPDEATPDAFARSVGLDVVRLLFPSASEEASGGNRRRVRFLLPRGE